MQRTLTLIPLALIALAAHGQCNHGIPSNALVIVQNQTQPASNQQVWVCEGLTNVIVQGTSNVIAVESDVTGFGVTGAENTVYAKSGTFLVINGVGNTIYLDNGAQILSGATGNTVINCTQAMVFNYANAPANGCAGVGVEELEPAVELELFPNPVNDMLSISLGDGVTMNEVRVVDLGGRLVLRQPGAPQVRIDMSGLEAGTYLVLIDTDRGELLRRVTKR